MPPRFAYWTILIDDKPTAFRARDQQELLPTVNQLKRKNQNVVMKWFAQGKLWDSPEAQRAAGRRPKFTGEKRGGDWRPGGTHKDPRDRFKKKNRPERAWSEGDKPVGPARGDRPWSPKPERPPRGAASSDRPWQTKPSGPRSERKPWRHKPAGPPRSDRPWQNKKPDVAQAFRPAGGRKPWSGKPSGGEKRPWSGKPDDKPRKRRDDEPPDRD